MDRARQAASAGQFHIAIQTWQIVLDLLPPDATERQGVMREMDRLNAKLQPKVGFDWRKRLGPFGAVLAFLAKFKTAALILLTKGKFLISMLAFVALYWVMFGWWFAVGFFASIFIHELGHYLVIRSYGMQAELPMFIPGFGAYVRWTGAGTVDPGVARKHCSGRTVLRFAIRPSGIRALLLDWTTRLLSHCTNRRLAQPLELNPGWYFRRGKSNGCYLDRSARGHSCP